VLLGALVAITFIAGLTLAFVKIAAEVVEGDTTSLDRAVLLALRNQDNLSDPLGPPWVEEAARDLTALGSTVVLALVTAAATIYLIIVGRWRVGIWVTVSIVSGSIISTLLKNAFDRPRPALFDAATRVFTMSFPSGHAGLSAVSYLTLGALLASVSASRSEKLFFLLLAVLLTLSIGLSRVYLGVHFPTDVLAGWCFGSAWATVCCALGIWLQGRGRAGTPP
jgi:undecaprenyl-diphosphatase